jgi:hypothetical protein
LTWDYFAFVDAVLSEASGLKAPARLVATTMARRGATCYDSYASLAKRTGLARRTVFTAIQELVVAGWIERRENRGQVIVWNLAIPVQEMHQCNRCTSAGDATGSAGDATVPVQELHYPVQELHTERAKKEPLERAKKEQGWEPPAWFSPLTRLTGYKQGGHESAAIRIEQTCEAAGVDKATVVEQFASEYETLKFSYGWGDPVAVLKGRPLAIAISNAKKARASPNGYRRSTRPPLHATDEATNKRNSVIQVSE